MTQTYTSRLHFAAVVRRAIAEGTLLRYARDLRLGRTAVLCDGTELVYIPAWRALWATS